MRKELTPEAVVAIREEFGLSQKKMAELINMSRTGLIGIEQKGATGTAVTALLALRLMKKHGLEASEMYD